MFSLKDVLIALLQHLKAANIPLYISKILQKTADKRKNYKNDIKVTF